tara:strand:+ start:132 stop:467 length:336 start_codon:yes stop_codon:yes gene_type:complete
MKPRFISDIHLSEDNPNLTGAFKAFLNESKQACTHLFILGDLFEIWIGDDDDSPFIQDIKKALIDFTSDGPETFLMHGNRDFLMVRLLQMKLVFLYFLILILLISMALRQS